MVDTSSNELNHDKHDIDISKIWSYERGQYLKQALAENWEDNKEMYNYLQLFYIKKKAIPFLKAKDIQPDNKYVQMLNQLDENKLPLDFFRYLGNYYDMQEPCITRLVDVNIAVFEKIFAFYLRQYKDDLREVESFLDFHLVVNFQGDIQRYEKFLSDALLQFSSIIDKRIIKIKSKWCIDRLKRETNIITDQATINCKALTKGNTDDNIHEIAGKMSHVEIKQYFSFLYLEKDKAGRSFMHKEDVEKMLENGITYESLALNMKFDLHYSDSFPKSIVEYCIHTFINYHLDSNRKQDVLRFFANNIEQFSKALDTPKAFKHWCNNVNGSKPKRMRFSINKYLPNSDPLQAKN